MKYGFVQCTVMLAFDYCSKETKINYQNIMNKRLLSLSKFVQRPIERPVTINDHGRFQAKFFTSRNGRHWSLDPHIFCDYILFSVIIFEFLVTGSDVKAANFQFLVIDN